MANYQNGKIYTIRSPHTDKIYIGSTIQSLYKRYHHHKSKFKTLNKTCSSYKMFEYGDSYIELLEILPCNSKMELNKREGELIRIHRDKCVNICVAGRTREEYIQENKEKIQIYKKAYQQINKEKMRIFREKNKESVRDKEKVYRKLNKERIHQTKKHYRLANKEALLIKDRERYQRNKESVAITCKNYTLANREKYLAQKKQYREANKDKIKEYRDANKDIHNERRRAVRLAKKTSQG